MLLAKSILLGLSVADAVGVPVEFQDRESLRRKPVADMQGYGTYNLPPGSFSDDSSLSFCLAESLTRGYDLEDIARQLIAYRRKALWTPYGRVFDIGNQTNIAIGDLEQILEHGNGTELPYCYMQHDAATNGNGALMRILPLLLLTRNMDTEDIYDITREVAGLTHGHIRSVFACCIYLIMADKLSRGVAIEAAYHATCDEAFRLADHIKLTESERYIFRRILGGNIGILPEEKINSGGYVMDSIEAAFWLLLNYDSYKSVVLAAANLGRDTDTTACIAGGLAALAYGEESIPPHWIQQMARLNDILKLADTLDRLYPAL